MKAEEKNRKSAEPKRKTRKLWSRLQVRMTTSYVVVSVVSALLIELLLIVIFFVVISPYIDQYFQDTAKRIAQEYAKVAATQGGGVALAPNSTFQPGQPSSLVLPGEDASQQVPYVTAHSPAPQMEEFALLLAPNGKILASSYPVRYPVSTSAAQLLPEQQQLILNALTGRGGSKVVITAQGHVISAVEPVWSKDRKTIGAIYVQATSIDISGNILSFAGFFLLATGLFWLIITAPIGAVFGVLTTRGLIRRLHRLVKATAQFADGDYSQRVPVTKRDEIGQMEQQFNSMAQQLVESME